MRRLLFLAVLLCGAASAQTVVQACVPSSANDEQTSQTGNTCTFGSNVTTGNLLVYFIKIDNTTSTIATALNALMTGETFTAATQRTSANATQQIRTYYTCSAVGGHTAFTYTFGGSPTSEFNAVKGLEISGVATASCLDIETGGQTVSASPSWTMTLSAAGIALLSSQTNNYTSYTAGSGYTISGGLLTGANTTKGSTGHNTDAGCTNSSLCYQGSDEYQVYSTSGSKTATYTTTGTNSFASEFIAFKAAAASTPAPTKKPLIIQ